MAVTGLEMKRRLANKVGQPYTTFSDNVKTNRLFSDALLWAIKDRSRKVMLSQEYPAEIGDVIVTNKAISVNNNQFYLAPLQIVGVSIANPAVITTLFPHNIANLETGVVISGVAGTGAITNANGTFTATVLTATTYSVPANTTGGTYTARTGIVKTAKMIPDYWDILAIKAAFNKQLYTLTVSAVTNPIVVTVRERNNLRTGEQILFANIGGLPSANGTFYIKTIGNYKVAQYTDQNLQNQNSAIGTYTNGGTLTRIFNNYCKPYASDTKISTLNTPTLYKPRFEQADRLMKIYPLNETCTGITMDYVQQPQQTIDVADNVTDMTLYFPEKFLWEVIFRAAFEFANPSRDIELRKLIDEEMVRNP